MDPFDEFEMKPLTTGLGFHRKAAQLNETPESTQVLIEENQEPTGYAQFLDQVKPTETRPAFRSPTLTTTLPRREAVEAPQINPEKTPPPVDRTPRISDLPPRKEGPKPKLELDFVDRKAPRAEDVKPARVHLKEISFSLRAAILDGIAIVALALLFLISLLLVTHVDLVAILMNIQSDLTTQISLCFLFAAIFQMYAVVSRSFMGRTLGEWTFDLQLGNHLQHESGLYPLKVAWRSLLVMMTGFLVLPLLSLLFGRDIAAPLTGLQLYKQNF